MRKTTKMLGAVMTVAVLSVAGCATKPAGQTTKTVAMEKGVPGGVMVETYQMTATVTNVDKTKRTVTLVTREGKKATYKAGPEVRNFDQIQVGDQLKVTAVDELAVFMRKRGTPPVNGEGAAVAIAPKGAKPGAFMVDTVEITAKVDSLDLKGRKATLKFADGKRKTFAVRDDIDMTKVNLGDEVVMRSTEAVAILVEKP